jgi:hypothetical protein
MSNHSARTLLPKRAKEGYANGAIRDFWPPQTIAEPSHILLRGRFHPWAEGSLLHGRWHGAVVHSLVVQPDIVAVPDNKVSCFR